MREPHVADPQPMPPPLEIPCPQCGKLLKLLDRSLLGKKGRCGKCRHKFLLEDPEQGRPLSDSIPVFASLDDASPEPPVEFELVTAPRVEPEKPLVGIAPRWVPDAAGPSLAEEPAEVPLALPTVGAAVASEAAPDNPFGVGLADVDFDSTPPVRRRRSGRRLPVIVAAVVILAVAGGVTAYLAARPSGKSEVTSGTATKKTGKVLEANAGNAAEPRATPTDDLPTHGKPLSLAYVPMGARILIHLRPAQLWESGGPAEEFRACLGPLGQWVEEQLKQQTMLDPAQVDSLLCALIPVSRDEFDVAFVVRARQDVKRSALIDKFGGELVDKPRQHYRNDRRLLWMVDARTLAIAPREMADSLFESASGDSVTSDGIQSLLSRTDRDRHFTLVCELEDVRNGMDKLVPANVRNLLAGTLDFLGDEVETAVWSVHLGDPDVERGLYSELMVRNRNTRSPANLQRDLQEKLERLPGEMLDLVYRTNPRQTGERKIIGRFPIMTKVVEQSTRFEVRGRTVSLRWNLPERSASNLALGTLLTWKQTTLPEFGKQASPRPSVPDANLPKTIAERLQKRIDVEFRDDFLYVALNFITEETGVEFKLDGPGMKRVGSTQNEKQKMNVQNTPAVTILDQMLTPKKLVLIVDEQKKIATVTSIDAAEDQKLKIFPLKAESDK